MAIVDEIKLQTKINQSELIEISTILFNTFEIKKEYKDKGTIDKKEFLIDGFADYLKQYLVSDIHLSNKDKLTIINFISKLKFQSELLELMNGNMNIEDIKSAGKKIGEKSQSTFE